MCPVIVKQQQQLKYSRCRTTTSQSSDLIILCESLCGYGMASHLSGFTTRVRKVALPVSLLCVVVICDYSVWVEKRMN